ncbi:MAG: hypothetical protein UW42_C0014G0001, partial [Candidatus Collierbacteria bacterium GW2011_GWB1_44_197]
KDGPVEVTNYADFEVVFGSNEHGQPTVEFIITCPGCGQKLHVTDETPGKEMVIGQLDFADRDRMLHYPFDLGISEHGVFV